MPIRIYALAKELEIDSKELVEICTKAGIPGKGSALASLDDDEVAKVKAYLARPAPAEAAAGTASGRSAGRPLLRQPPQPAADWPNARSRPPELAATHKPHSPATTTLRRDRQQASKIRVDRRLDPSRRSEPRQGRRSAVEDGEPKPRRDAGDQRRSTDARHQATGAGSANRREPKDAEAGNPSAQGRR